MMYILCIKMAYVRYKLSDDLHKILKDVCKKLGLKESELSRQALLEYLKSLSILSEKVKEKK